MCVHLDTDGSVERDVSLCPGREKEIFGFVAEGLWAAGDWLGLLSQPGLAGCGSHEETPLDSEAVEILLVFRLE